MKQKDKKKKKKNSKNYLSQRYIYSPLESSLCFLERQRGNCWAGWLWLPSCHMPSGAFHCHESQEFFSSLLWVMQVLGWCDILFLQKSRESIHCAASLISWQTVRMQFEEKDPGRSCLLLASCLWAWLQASKEDTWRANPRFIVYLTNIFSA